MMSPSHVSTHKVAITTDHILHTQKLEYRDIKSSLSNIINTKCIIHHTLSFIIYQQPHPQKKMSLLHSTVTYCQELFKDGSNETFHPCYNFYHSDLIQVFAYNQSYC